MSATNGNVKTIPAATVAQTENETAHYIEAERLLNGAWASFRSNGACPEATILTAMAQVHASLSMASDHDRLAACVPDGGSRFQVNGR